VIVRFPDVPGSLHGNTGRLLVADGNAVLQEVAHWSASDPGPAGWWLSITPRRYGEQHGLDLGFATIAVVRCPLKASKGLAFDAIRIPLRHWSNGRV